MRCGRCMAEDGKNHPTADYLVELEKILINNATELLCQKCKVRRAFQNKKAANTAKRFSLKNFLKTFLLNT